MNTALRPFRPITPGEILQEELEAGGWTDMDLAEIVDDRLQAINEIISGRKVITPDTAVALSRALDSSPEYWLNLESAYRLDTKAAPNLCRDIARQELDRKQSR